jgi:uncharacterized membrane protein
MNRLEKRAWATLGGMILCVIIAGPGIWWLVRVNAKGLAGLIPFLITGLIVMPITYRRNLKSYAKLDEREKNIAQKAGRLSNGVFILFLYCASFTVFLIVGANNPIPAYLLPVLFLSGLFLMVFVYSAAILVQFARERDDEQ